MFQHKTIYLFGLATPRACQSPGYLNAVCCRLTNKENDESPPDHSPENDTLAHRLPSIAEKEDNETEHFPTISLDDNIWIEEHIPERLLCIHENSQHDLYPYPCHFTQEDALQYIDLNNIFKFPDVVVSATMMIYPV